MKKTNQKNTILAVAPCTTGFGYAFMREPASLIKLGNTWVEGSGKNKQSLKAMEKMIKRLDPGVIVLPDTLEKGSQRAKRIQRLVQQITSLAIQYGIPVKLIRQKQLQVCFFGGEKRTKYARAKILAQRFPQELAHLLPPKRPAWRPENPKMDMFDAIALALASIANNSRE